MATHRKSTRGTSWPRAALETLFRPKGTFGTTPSPGCSRADDPAGAAFAYLPQASLASNPDFVSSGRADPDPPCDVYAERGQGPYLRDAERELYEQDDSPATRQVRSDMRIFFTTALAVVVLGITIYFHVTA